MCAGAPHRDHTLLALRDLPSQRHGKGHPTGADTGLLEVLAELRRNATTENHFSLDDLDFDRALGMKVIDRPPAGNPAEPRIEGDGVEMAADRRRSGRR